MRSKLRYELTGTSRLCRAITPLVTAAEYEKMATAAIIPKKRSSDSQNPQVTAAGAASTGTMGCQRIREA